LEGEPRTKIDMEKAEFDKWAKDINGWKIWKENF
jgi:hypothetical protein